MSKLKVFSGVIFRNGKQVQAIVATTSQKKASIISGENLSYIRSHWTISQNKTHIAISINKPDTLFVSSGMFKCQ